MSIDLGAGGHDIHLVGRKKADPQDDLVTLFAFAFAFAFALAFAEVAKKHPEYDLLPSESGPFPAPPDVSGEQGLGCLLESC